MRILVGVKRVVDYAVKVRVGKSGVELKNVKMSLNPFCEIAVEEAVRLKESKHATEVIACSIGPKKCADTLKTAMAMGCDRSIHIITDMRTDYMGLQPLSVAKILQNVVMKEKADLVLVGKQSIDSDCGQTGPMLAGLLGVPQITFASKIVPTGDGSGLDVERETDAGTETINISSLPAVISCDLRLNVPRYPKLKSIIAAKKKKIEKIVAEDMGIDLEPMNEVVEVYEPSAREAGVLVNNVDELLDKLRNEASAIP
mmetsp:Transcript_57143/g.66797  ORF Transcript_57143/g.66797 Transcript_57143/m.66797 type:complete len:257 (-) Transcript_57143:168-938(-)|eukprot:CAMPEP_0194359692 /NCGR_PEP_ID=MMETSP0174-20130528/6966_1 /TAXON_ID=216777 /ORGANISM="Proboscia alata, Strain PI-D3" /LENGTH=256 /DNA_ID=CAMNT_0039130741 /DNA_START=198 /DNA_END=968 /DNA_ORIENTATION=-